MDIEWLFQEKYWRDAVKFASTFGIGCLSATAACVWAYCQEPSKWTDAVPPFGAVVVVGLLLARFIWWVCSAHEHEQQDNLLKTHAAYTKRMQAEATGTVAAAGNRERDTVNAVVGIRDIIHNKYPEAWADTEALFLRVPALAPSPPEAR